MRTLLKVLYEEKNISNERKRSLRAELERRHAQLLVAGIKLPSTDTELMEELNNG